jgi:iron-sulfur cluster repair protein YtfE (RIC family)
MGGLQTPKDVVRHVVQQHHDFATAMVTVLRPQLKNAVALEAPRWPAVIELASAFDALALELQNHCDAEQSRIFPALLDGTITREQRRFVRDAHARLLVHLALIDGLYASVPDASPRVATLKRALARLSADVKKDIAIEDALLFATNARPGIPSFAPETRRDRASAPACARRPRATKARRPVPATQP